MRRVALVAIAGALLALPGTAFAAFPGQNGKIAYDNGGDIWTVDPDGTDATQLTSGSAVDTQPNWSPDGKQIAFMSNRDSIAEIYVMDADGTDVRRVTYFGTASSSTIWPAWSPDGTRIAYARNGHLWTIAADGTDEQRVTPDPSPGSECVHIYDRPVVWSPNGRLLSESGWSDCGEREYGFHCFVAVVPGGGGGCPWEQFGEAAADWSPDSHEVIVGVDGETHGLYRMGVAPGWCCIELTPPLQAADGYDGNAAWSPDGSTIVFRRDPWDGSPSQVYLIDADGGNQRALGGPHVGCCYDWQSIPINAYPRPKGASPMQVSLVPAYQACTSANRAHGPPLAFPSCAPPQRTPGQLTIGTADSNQRPTKSVSMVQIGVRPGIPSTTADEADLRLFGTVNDVRLASDLSDYTGQLEARMSVRITDKDNTPHPGGPGAGTVQDITYSFPIPCAATSNATVGGDCTFETTAEAFIPGLVKELRRSVWELGSLHVHDGAGGLFMTQGIFVP